MRLYNKLSWVFIFLVVSFGFGIMAYVVFVSTPSFLSEIRNGLVNNGSLMKAIGGEQGYALYYSGETLPDKRFHVTVHGACDSAYVRVDGVYHGDQYTVTDTIVVPCKPSMP